jgi:hypothetical protein
MRPEQRGHLGAGLHEAEDVVDEQQHVLAALVAEVLGHRQAGQRDAHARPGRLVHLAEDEHGLVDHARLGHLEPEVVALARALAHAAEGRQAAVLLGEVVDELLDEHGLAHAGAAEQADLAALGVGREQVDDLDAGLEHLGRRRQVLDGRGRAVDRPALLDLDRSPWSIVSPSRLKMRPSVTSPTGTLIGPPVSTTSSRATGRRSCPSATARRGRRRGAAGPRSTRSELMPPESFSSSRVVSRLTTIAELISGAVREDASITTPWISSIRPTFFFSVSAVAAIESP